MSRRNDTILRPIWPFQVNHQSPQAAGLLAWWPMALPGGRRVQDFAGNNSGTITTLSGANWGEGLTLTGTTDARIGAQGALQLTTYTIWARLLYAASASGEKVIYAYYSNIAPFNGVALLANSSGSWRLFHGDATTFANLTATGFPTGRVVDVAVTFGAGRATAFYIDGRQVSTGTHTRTPSFANGTASLGALVGETNPQYWIGDYYDARIYDRALSAAEVYALYDPQTRYDLYWSPWREYSFPPAGGASVTGAFTSNAVSTVAAAGAVAKTDSVVSSAVSTVVPSPKVARTTSTLSAAASAVVLAGALALHGAAAPSAQSTVSFSGTVTKTGAVASAGQSAASFSGVGTYAGAVAPAAQSAVAFAGAVAKADSTTIAAQSAFTPTAAVAKPGAVASNATSTVSFAGSVQGQVDAATAIAGQSAASFTGAVSKTGSIAPAGQSAAVFTGAVAKPGAVSSAGQSAVAFVGAVAKAGALAPAAASTASFTAAVSKTGATAIAAVSAFLPAGTVQGQVDGAVSAAAHSAVSFAGAVAKTGGVAASGQSAVSLVGSLAKTGAITSNATSTVALAGVRTRAGAVAIAATSTFLPTATVDEGDIEGAAAIGAQSTVSFTAAVTRPAAITIAAQSTVAFAGTVSGQAGRLALTVSRRNTITITIKVAGVSTANIDIGDIVDVEALFENNAGVDTDPTVVSFTVQGPLGERTEYLYGTDSEVTKTATGIFNLAFEPTDPGVHVVRVVGSGALKAAERDTFTVRSQF